MSEPPPSESDAGAPRSPRPDGIGPLLASALATLLDHFEARADLFLWEVGEARSRLLRRLVCAVAGVVALLAAYAIAVAALVGWIAESQSMTWPMAAFAVALGHLLLAAILLLLARRGRGGALFSDSLAELRRDREVLRRKAGSTRPRDWDERP